jgi:hypothetical protein
MDIMFCYFEKVILFCLFFLCKLLKLESFLGQFWEVVVLEPKIMFYWFYDKTNFTM